MLFKIGYISTIENTNIKETKNRKIALSYLLCTKVTELAQKIQFLKKSLTLLQGLEQKFMKILLYMTSPLTNKQLRNSSISN